MINYLLGLLVLTAITSIIVLGLNARWSWAGEFDLSYYAFVAIGAYVTAVLIAGPSGGPNGPVPPPDGWILGLKWPFLPAMIISVLVTGGVAALLGAIALRKLRGDYLAITTLSFILIVTFLFSQDYQLFNGFNGVYGLPQPFYNANFSPTTYTLIFAAVCLVFLAIVYVLLEWMLKSPFGLTLRSIREDEQAAAAFGRNVFAAKLKVFVIGGMVAAVGGSLFAVYLTSWDPGAWSTIEGFLLFAGVFLGGQGNSRGVMLGAFIVIIAIPEASRYLPEFQSRPDLYPALRNVVSGFVILGILRWRPQGIFPERHLRDAPGGRGLWWLRLSRARAVGVGDGQS